jgi:hypothetical protein
MGMALAQAPVEQSNNPTMSRRRNAEQKDRKDMD